MKKLLNKEMGFMAGLSVYMVILLLSSDNLNTGTKAMPYAAIAIAFFCILLKMIVTLRSDPTKVTEADDEEETEEKVKLPIGERIKNWQTDDTFRSIAFILWAGLTCLLFNLLGFLPAMFCALFLILFFISKVSIVKSVLISAGTLLVLYLIFVVALKVNFPVSILFD